MTAAAARRGAAAAPRPITPDRLERALGWLSLVMLAFVVLAVFRGMADWGKIPGVIWLHLATIAIALGLTPVLLWKPRGTAGHRKLGYAWSAAMFLTAVDSLFVTTSHPGQFSPIHALSAFTIVAVPVVVLSARRHKVERHRRTVRGLVIGALLIAGFFTFPFDRLLGHWLFG
ncbi:DUF2306 domain-containing protein [Novosphingobium soli]|uniref:DUF2306 domain-containing protein n=1 Tax=Novosphingobium soli TaxID=574956 RepID=A0ABV6CXW0_9SPHN